MKDATVSNAPRPKRRVKKKGSATNPYAEEGKSNHVIELGLALSLIVVLLYCFGVFESVQSLPGVKIPVPTSGNLGGNLNPALSKIESPTNDAAGTENKPAPVMDPSGVKRTQVSDVHIPETHWPVSVRNENDYDTVIHPGDMTTELSVPKFWAAPVHNGGLMTKELALKIGSCAEPDPKTGSVVRGDDCPPDERTIYFAIASYRDFQCRQTVESAFSRAKNPRRIRVGVVDQIVDGEDVPCDQPIEPCETNPKQALCMYKDQVDVYEMEAELSVGPVFARHIGHRLYRGEYYSTQSDAHVSYTNNWDADIISQFESLGNEMAVLTTYLTDVQGSISPEGDSLRKTRPIMCNTDFEGGAQGQHLRHGSQPERMPAIKGAPQMEPYWAAGYSFSRGHFIVNVPYDFYQPMIFQGEEMSIGLRAWSVSYDMYAPARSVCFHHYAVGNNAKVRNKVPHFWEHGRKFKGIGKKAMERLLGIVHMNPEIPVDQWDHKDEHLYGLGGVRTPEKFFETFGIDIVNKKTEHHLCSFVDLGGKMHQLFTPFLREDGMGIDYSKIQYQFKDPRPGQK